MVAAVEGKHRLSEPAPSGLGARATSAPGRASPARETFVLGIFSEPDAANTAIHHLAATLENGDDAVLMSRSGLRGRSDATDPPFDTLWASLCVSDGTETHGPIGHGTASLAADLKQRLADGASVVIARTKGSGQQLTVSRALLEAGCDVLLSHDVTSHGSGTPGNHAHTPVIFP